MASNELIPLFPSALHPAIPIATQILSTLRSLTAPGRGNDLRPEERAALVGVAALLGCERVQSKDLVESSAQKASSVSPARFRTALTKSRRILDTVSASDPSLEPSTSSRRSSQSPHRPQTLSPSKGSAEGPNTAGSSGAADAASPFSTPRKKFKYTSGIDISDLVRSTPRHAHEPGTASPLRQSVTPGSRRETIPRSVRRQPRSASKPPNLDHQEQDTDERAGDDEGTGDDGEDLGGYGEEERTPTKKVKYGIRSGVDLESATKQVSPSTSNVDSASRRKMDTSAFFALRPGSGPGPANGVQESPGGRGKTRVLPFEDGLPDVRPSPRRSAKQGSSRNFRQRRKRDWTYTERIWTVTGKDQEVVRKVLADLPDWLREHGRPSLAEMKLRGSTVEEILAARPNTG